MKKDGRSTLRRLALLATVTTATLLLTVIFTATPAATQGTAVSIEDWQSKACQTCHPQE